MATELTYSIRTILFISFFMISATACGGSGSLERFKALERDVDANVKAGLTSRDIDSFLSSKNIEFSTQSKADLEHVPTPSSQPALAVNAVARIQFIIKEEPGEIVTGGITYFVDADANGHVVSVKKNITNTGP